MKDQQESIRKTNYSEWHTVKCIKDLIIECKTNNYSFKANTEYEASKISNNWWLIDSVGISSKEFENYFKDEYIA